MLGTRHSSTTKNLCREREEKSLHHRQATVLGLWRGVKQVRLFHDASSVHVRLRFANPFLRAEERFVLEAG